MSTMTAKPRRAHTTRTPGRDGRFYEVSQMGVSCYYDTLTDAILGYWQAAADATPHDDHPCLYVDNFRIHSSNLLYDGDDFDPRPIAQALDLVREQIARGY